MQKQIDFWINEVQRLNAGIVQVKPNSPIKKGTLSIIQLKSRNFENFNYNNTKQKISKCFIKAVAKKAKTIEKSQHQLIVEPLTKVDVNEIDSAITGLSVSILSAYLVGQYISRKR
jgi:hypothetical protein